MALTNAERETILRWDEAEKRLHVFTSSARVMRRWRKRGIPLAVTSRDRDGEPQGWRGLVPLGCLRPLRALGPDGEFVQRRPSVAVKRA